MKLGMGLVGLDNWTSAQPLVDLLNPFTTQWPAPKPGFTYGLDGWPLKIPPGTFPDNWMGWVMPYGGIYLAPGKYQVWATGSGKFYFGHPDLAASGQQNTWTVTSPADGVSRLMAEFTVIHPDAGQTLCTVFSIDPANPLRRLAVIPATENRANLFTRQYVGELSHFSALRTGGYTRVVASTEVDWPGGHMNPAGIPARWLAAVKLCNETKCDMWVNFPHMASDSYIKTLAAYIRATLNPALTIYLEYSDEIWNWGYPFAVATKWVEDWGHANLGPTYPYQMSAVERVHHLQDVFCQAATGLKVVRLFADQHFNPWLFGQAGDYIKAKGYKFDAVATAPYAGSGNVDWNAVDALVAAGNQSGAMDLLFADLEASIPTLDGFAQQYRAKADELGIPRMLAYECGPGYQIPRDWPKSRLDLYAAHHASPRMHDFLANTYFPWMAKYYDLAMYTSHTIKSWPGEAWGVKETAGQAPCPKLDACLEWCAAYNGKPIATV